ncbi:COPII-coated vesicle membrane protein [Talaromyces proteolyticus]|uniref:COPII-coated vesicle membrane protein n=1 Tax=Talaromyces proteolyticus TaxID=1131652 RepID=A0AAD4KX26_9EURO|nr:COPII-coated vesicle membrane protein [Talaromyces proteolyticus]KAH8702069.1 COPII-coated vesicle membrane protein [Talaromyces proteolyticus]
MVSSTINPRAVLGIFFVLFTSLSSALKFELAAQQHSNERCIRNFVSAGQLVVVTAIVSGTKGDGQVVNMHIKDALGNDYSRPKDVVGENRQTLTPSEDTAFDVCFENLISDSRRAGNKPIREVELDIEIGADARDWSSVQAAEKLKPVETDLRRIEEVVAEIVTEMEYLRQREQKLRDTNESTNERVKWFAFGTMGMLVGLGAWQVVYLRAYFRSKHLI